MNRIALDSVVGGRRASIGSQLHHLRGGGGDDAADDSLDLFSRTRRSDGGAPLISSTAIRSDGESTRLEKISVGLTRIGKGMEDLLDAEIGKHDYDWLLTPPETPLYPSAVARESPMSLVTRESPLSSVHRESPLSTAGPRGRTNVRSISSTRPSRLSTSQTENSHSIRPVRSSSVTRSSISSTYSSSSFSNNNRTSVLNTSSASVTSSRPSTPGNRSSTPRPSANSTSGRPSANSTSARPASTSTIARPSSASTTTRPSTVRSVPSRMPTPTRTRPNPSGSGDRTTRPSNSSRPSTPTSTRPQTPSNPIPNQSSRANSRSSTPTRRPTSSAGSSSSASIVGSRFPSVGRISSMNNRNSSAPSSRPSSPGPRPRAPVRPMDVPDFPADAPPNLRTKLPDRPVSAGRTRPGMALTVRASSTSNSESEVPAVAAHPPSSNRRNYMPVLSRGRFPENPPKATAKLHGGNNRLEAAATADIQKLTAPDGGLRRPTKSAPATESTGFGRTISKKSLDMALRHMDIRQGMGGIRASSLFPQSIRSMATKGRLSSKSDPVVPLAADDSMADNGSCNGTMSPDCRSSFAHSENGDVTATPKSPDRDSLAAGDSELDNLQGSSRYDAFMLKEEDSKSMNWLHSVEDKSDQSPMFDHRFEPLPEPFGLL